MLSNLIKFIRSRIFFVNLLAASVLMAAVFFGIYFWLGNFTHHGAVSYTHLTLPTSDLV